MRHKARSSRREARQGTPRRGREERVIKEKFLEERKERTASKPIVPLNERQAEYMEAIYDLDLIVATGYAGTSKTFIPTSLAADAYYRGDCKQIVLARPAVSNSKSLGFFSGDSNEKMQNWTRPLMAVLYKRLGREVVDLAIAHGNIQFQPLETIKGMSYDRDTWVIIDEAEDCDIDEIKMLVTRHGGCKMILCGDILQSALKEGSGLAIFTRRVVPRHAGLAKRTGLINFDKPEHIVRSGVCRDAILAFQQSGY